MIQSLFAESDALMDLIILYEIDFSVIQQPAAIVHYCLRGT